MPVVSLAWKLTRTPANFRRTTNSLPAHIDLFDNKNYTLCNFDDLLRNYASNHWVNWTVVDSVCSCQLPEKAWMLVISLSKMDTDIFNLWQVFFVLGQEVTIAAFHTRIVMERVLLGFRHHCVKRIIYWLRRLGKLIILICLNFPHSNIPTNLSLKYSRSWRPACLFC